MSQPDSVTMAMGAVQTALEVLREPDLKALVDLGGPLATVVEQLELADQHLINGDDDGVAAIAGERMRQVVDEGWTPEHDAEHDAGQLSAAAYCYAWFASQQLRHQCVSMSPPAQWPWDETWWKPVVGAPERNLAKAGALIAAEIDRRQLVGAQP